MRIPEFGYQFYTARGARAFTVRVAGNDPAGQPLVHALVYESLDDKPWSGEVTASVSQALARPAAGRVPDTAALRARLIRHAEDLFDYTVRPSGTM